MSNIIVSKYGGSSTTCQEDVKRKRIITEDDSRRQVIVLSAHGKKSPYEKDTDMLIKLAETRDESIANKLIDRAREIYPGIPASKFEEMHNSLKSRIKKELTSGAYEDSIKAFGEYLCANLSASTYNYEFVDPKELFLVSSDFGNAKILPESEQMIRKRLADKKGHFVVPGFYGYTKDGLIATLDRGGSDLTGAYIAAALDAILYENFTDTDGIYAASPHIVENPRKVDEITFDEIRDLSYSGFKILYEEAMRPVGKKRIPIHVRNTFEYPKEGTYIVYDRLSDSNRPIIGIAYKGGLCSFEIAQFGLNRMGIGSKILQVFEKEGIPIEFITTGIDDMSIIFGDKELKKSPNNVGEISNELYKLIGEDTKIVFQEQLGSLVVAGKGLKGKKGIAANIQLTLAESGINIKFISQGPEERCIIYGVEITDGKKAVNAIYDKFLR